MSDFTATRSHLYVTGAIIFAEYHTDNETEIYTEHNAAFNATTGHLHTGATGDGPVLPGDSVDISAAGELTPIGSIIAHYDFNAAVAIDTNYWAYCDGSVVSNPDSVLNGLTLPDLSGRYLVGFGTDGGGDIDTAAWSTAAVGNASHQIDIAHTHTGPSHTHAGPSHTHTVTVNTHSHTFSATSASGGAGNTSYDGIHYHIMNTLGAHVHSTSSGTSGGWIESSSPGRYTNGSGYSYNGEHNHTSSTATSHRHTVANHTHTVSGTTSSTVATASTSASGSASTGASGTASTGASGTAATGASGTAATGASGTAATGSGLSATQSIQPRSIAVRYIMRLQ